MLPPVSSNCYVRGPIQCTPILMKNPTNTHCLHTTLKRHIQQGQPACRMARKATSPRLSAVAPFFIFSPPPASPQTERERERSTSLLFLLCVQNDSATGPFVARGGPHGGVSSPRSSSQRVHCLCPHVDAAAVRSCLCVFLSVVLGAPCACVSADVSV